MVDSRVLREGRGCCCTSGCSVLGATELYREEDLPAAGDDTLHAAAYGVVAAFDVGEGAGDETAGLPGDVPHAPAACRCWDGATGGECLEVAMAAVAAVDAATDAAACCWAS